MNKRTLFSPFDETFSLLTYANAAGVAHTLTVQVRGTLNDEESTPHLTLTKSGAALFIDEERACCVGCRDVRGCVEHGLPPSGRIKQRRDWSRNSSAPSPGASREFAGRARFACARCPAPAWAPEPWTLARSARGATARSSSYRRP